MTTPVHPALVHFPIALTVTSVLSETAAAVFDIPSLHAVGAWTILFAFVVGVATIAAGYWDMRRDALEPRTHAIVHLHLRFGLGVGSALALLVIWRWLGGSSIGYLVAGWAAMALLLFQAWLGGELVYAHGAGVAAAEQGQASPLAAQALSIRVYKRIMGRDPSQKEGHDH
jgi:uncharacterized membrane protein